MLIVGRLPFYRQTAESISQKSIAVLPFENRSEEKANAYFADGIQDEILTRLSKIADLKVISRTSTQHYKSAPENLPEIARQLGVAHILEGSVQKSGDAVRVNVQLIKAANESHLWADTFDRKLTDIFSVDLPAWAGLYIENGYHTRQRPWCAEISQRSGAVGPEVRPWLGAAVIR